MKRVVKWGVRILVAIVLVAQCIRPARTNPPVDEKMTIQANTEMSPDVSAILKRACYDCHSSNTVWPWYSNVSPISWFLVRHVNGGRRKLSFSDWGTYKAERRANKLKEICEQLDEGEMPLSTYLPLHPDARLSDADKELLCNWAKQEGARMAQRDSTLAR